MTLLVTAPLPFNAFIAFAVILGFGSLAFSVSFLLKRRK